MKINKLFYLICLLVFGLLIACQKNPLDTEQYFKQIYIVGALDIVKSFDVPYANTPQEAYISIATGGSQNIDRDVKVTLTHSDEMIDWYNNKYMIDAPIKYQKLDEQYYNIPSLTTVIKAGHVYERLPFFVHTEGLSCDSLYALTFKIKSVSDYQMNKKDTVLILNLNFVNDYSDTYQMTAIKYILDAEGKETAPTAINIQRTLKAVDENSVRFINEAIAEPSMSQDRTTYFNNIDNNSVVFTEIGEGLFAVTGWKNLDIRSGSAEYKDDCFTFSFDYSVGSQLFRLRGTLKR